jgi:hypothetical protein
MREWLIKWFFRYICLMIYGRPREWEMTRDDWVKFCAAPQGDMDGG